MDFGTTNRSPSKHGAQASVSWFYWALRVEYPVYQEGVIDRETRFFGPREMNKVEFRKNNPFKLFTITIGMRSIDRKHQRVKI